MSLEPALLALGTLSLLSFIFVTVLTLSQIGEEN